MLTYKDVSCLFSKTSGINDENIQFQTVSCLAGTKQPKGLFIPLSGSPGSLQDAIANGAVAALWPETEPIPAYTPNHFPIIYTKDTLKGLEKIMKSYHNYLLQQETTDDITKFIFMHKELLNENKPTYDIAVMAEDINMFGNANIKAGEE